MSIWYEVYKPHADDAMFEVTVAMCEEKWIADLIVLQVKNSKVRVVKQINTWKWKEMSNKS
jgi:hypothetical protein